MIYKNFELHMHLQTTYKVFECYVISFNTMHEDI